MATYGTTTIPFPALLDRLIFVGFTRIECADPEDAASFNLQAGVLGKDGIKFTPEGNFVERLDVVIGSVASPQLAVKGSMTVPVVKTSATAQRYIDRVFGICILNSSITFYDDTNTGYVMSNISVKWDGTEGSGQNPVYNFTIEGNLIINQGLFDKFGVPPITEW